MAGWLVNGEVTGGFLGRLIIGRCHEPGSSSVVAVAGGDGEKEERGQRRVRGPEWRLRQNVKTSCHELGRQICIKHGIYLNFRGLELSLVRARNDDPEAPFPKEGLGSAHRSAADPSNYFFSLFFVCPSLSTSPSAPATMARSQKNIWVAAGDGDLQRVTVGLFIYHTARLHFSSLGAYRASLQVLVLLCSHIST